jgi:outer membrane protein OmpA-like peptidoglycan-associated protein
MTFKALKKATVASVALCVAGCASGPGQPGGVQQAFNDTFNNPDPCAHNARNTGMVLGALAGTVIAAKIGHKDKGAMIAGALLGTTVGGLVGADIDSRRCELAKVAREYQLQMSFAAVTSDGAVLSDAQLSQGQNASEVRKNAIGNVVSLQDDAAGGGHFESNSDVLTARAERYFSAIADVYNLEKAARAIADPAARQNALRAGAQRKLLLVGHTDDTGQSRLNAELSERRARAVAEYLERRGIPRDQVYYQGAGEVYPVADNNTPTGRAQNRRVEIVEVTSAANFSRYLEARRPNYQFYRATARPEPAVAASAQAAPAPRDGAARTATKAAPPRTAKADALAARPAPARSASVPVPGQAAGAAVPTVRATAASAAARTASAASPAAPVLRVTGRALDFGGAPLNARQTAAAGIGKLDRSPTLFSLISDAHANEMPVLSDCSQDRPRVSGAVKALRDGATYKVAEHVPGLYGKTWTGRVNGHQVVINKVAVLASEASLAQIPELKVYANYDPSVNRNPKPDMSLRPEVNTYLAERGILYRIFTNGAGGMQCVDVLYPRNGGAAAKGGNIVYAHDNRLYVSDFKPVIAN